MLTVVGTGGGDPLSWTVTDIGTPIKQLLAVSLTGVVTGALLFSGQSEGMDGGGKMMVSPEHSDMAVLLSDPSPLVRPPTSF